MPFYHVSYADIKVKTMNGKLALTSKEVLATLPPDISNDKIRPMTLFENYEMAVKFAKGGIDEFDLYQFVIFEVIIINKKDIEKVEQLECRLSDHDNDHIFFSDIVAFESPADNVILIKASLKHVDENFEDILVLDEKGLLKLQKAMDAKDAALTAKEKELADKTAELEKLKAQIGEGKLQLPAVSVVAKEIEVPKTTGTPLLEVFKLRQKSVDNPPMPSVSEQASPKQDRISPK